MGTYTTNYNLFMPTIGEQGWGTLVNGNFSTIDTTMKGLNTRVGTLDTEINAVEEKVTALEPLLSIQVDENQNVTFPANITVNGTVIQVATINVTPSTTTVILGKGNTNYNAFWLLPFQQNGMYTGTLKHIHDSWSVVTYHAYNTDGTISTESFTGDSGANKTHTIPSNTKGVFVSITANVSIYLPLLS